jgi:short repeat uncharacterized protein DUF308
MRAETISVEGRSILAVVDVDTLVRNWWVVALRGVAGILFGLIAVVAPGISLVALVLVFGAFAFADGVLAIVSAVRGRGVSDRWWVLLLQGLAGVAASVVTVVWPNLTTLALHPGATRTGVGNTASTTRAGETAYRYEPASTDPEPRGLDRE